MHALLMSSVRFGTSRTSLVRARALRTVLGEHEHAAARGHEILHRRTAESVESVEQSGLANRARSSLAVAIGG
jgi:hypothetical protein